MPALQGPTLDGTVTIVQEGRFQLVDQNGVAHLFLLAYGASPEPSQLAALQRSQTRVRVRYGPAGDLIARRATRITVLD
jgi:hypothetical protein